MIEFDVFDFGGRNKLDLGRRDTGHRNTLFTSIS
jgi:hypothetical protein